MKLLSHARDLQRRKARERHGRFVAEGVRTVEALLASPLEVVGVLHTPGLVDTPRGAALWEAVQAIGVPAASVSDAEFASASDTESPQGVLAIAAIPSHALPAPGPALRLLLLDALQDPGNVGTIARTAAALGATATVALPGTVDLWNAKVVRASMGAHFTHPVLSLPWDVVADYLEQHAVALWAADAAGVALGRHPEVPDRLALAVSNEGAGLSPVIRQHAAACIAIPMTPGSESLNVAVATGILLHALATSQPSS